MRRLLRAAGIAAGLTAGTLALTACGGATKALEDPDAQRHQAKPLPLDKVIVDSLTWDVDKSDWKIFFIEQQGLVTVTTHFDTPGGNCEMYLRDKYGAQMAREVQSNNQYVKLVRRVVEPTRLFVWVNSSSEKCSTGYAIEAKIDPD